MSVLVFDTETSGLHRDRLEWDDPSQPHLLQLAWKLFDPGWIRRQSEVALMRPDGWSIEAEAEGVHGIPEGVAARYGGNPKFALIRFREAVALADLIVAHHMEFDRKVIMLAGKRCGAAMDWFQARSKDLFCTMENATEHCQIPGKFGFKFPSLDEALEHFSPGGWFSRPRERHDAEEDVDRTVALYRMIVGAGKLPIASRSAPA